MLSGKVEEFYFEFYINALRLAGSFIYISLGRGEGLYFDDFRFREKVLFWMPAYLPATFRVQ